MFAVFLVLFWSLVEVHSQTAPYVSFMGDILPNHAYVDLTTVGEFISDTVRCNTDLSTCCVGDDNFHRGELYFPNGSVLSASGAGGNIYRSRGDLVIYLHRRNDAMSPSGIYHCEIETMAVNDNDTDTITGETVYVALYLPNEGIGYTYTDDVHA